MTVLMNEVESSPNPTARTAGANRAAAPAISGQWNAPATFSRICLPPASLTATAMASRPSSLPEITTWPGQL